MAENVLVLLSTYNGEKYISQQLDSILSQSDVNIRLLIRDDGSSDKTSDIIKSYNDGRITLIKGENIGSTSSFLKLIEFADDADYYAFSDQDDVWDSDKLSTAVSKLREYENVPAVYSSNQRLVDSNLNILSQPSDNHLTTLGSAMIKNYATGCTVVFNNRLMKQLKSAKNVSVSFHDWWVNLVALTTNGVSVFDTDAHISYRQHSDNVVGAASGFFGKWKKRFLKFIDTDYRRDLVAAELLECYGDSADDETVSILKSFSDYKQNRLSLIKDKRIRTGNKTDDLMFFILVLLSKL